MKDVGLRIRVQRELRDKFIEACRNRDVPAAQVLREFMREYVDTGANTQTSQADHNEGHKRQRRKAMIAQE